MKKMQSKTYAQHRILDGDAEIYRHDRSGDIWQYRFYNETENKHYRISLKTRDYDEAVRKAKAKTIDILTRIQGGRKLYGITLQTLVNLYIKARLEDVDDERGITLGRVKSIKSQLTYCVKILGAKKRVSSMDKKCLKDYVQLRKLSHNARPYTAKNEITTINHMWKWGYNEGLTSFYELVFNKVRVKASSVGRRDTFTDKEYNHLCRYMRTWILDKNCFRHTKYKCAKTGRWLKGEYVFSKELQLEKQMVRDFILISANSGLRVGEQRQLKYSDILGYEEYGADDDNEQVVLAKVNVRWRTSKVKTTRTFLSRGGQYFKRLRDRQHFTEGSDLIFSMDGKHKLSVDKWTEYWKQLMNGIGIEYDRTYIVDEEGDFINDEDGNRTFTGRDIKYYSLRHYCITSRVKSGVSVVDVAKMCGTGISQIEKHYMHYAEEQSRAAALKSFTTKDGINTPIDSLTKKKLLQDEEINEYGTQRLTLQSKYVH